MGACFESKESIKANDSRKRSNKKDSSNVSNTNNNNFSTSNSNLNSQKISNNNIKSDININIPNKKREENNDNFNKSQNLENFNYKKENGKINQNDNTKKNNNIYNDNSNNINNNANNNKEKEDYFDSGDVEKSIQLLKSEGKNNLHIQKTLEEKIYNCNYKINLKITIKRVTKKSNFKITLILNQKNDISSEQITKEESEKLSIDKNQVVTFNKDFIVDYRFNIIQPLSFIVTNFIEEEQLSINLGDIIGKPRQIYFHNFSYCDCEIEAKMHSQIKKQVQFLTGLYGDLKEKNIFYTITYVGNRYDKDKKNNIIYKSDIAKHDTQIIFKQIDLPFEKISEDEKIEDNLIEISFYNKNNENDEELGKEKFSVEQLLNNKENEIILQNNIKAKIACKRKNFFNLLEYIYNDFHLVTTFCIDFSTDSLVRKDTKNFENLLQTFLNTLVPYNGDKFFYCYSYGFKLIKTQKDYINEIFPLNRKIPSIEMDDVIPYFEKGLKKFERSSMKNDLGLIVKCLNNKIKENSDFEDKQYNLFIIFASYDVIDEQNFMNELIETSKLNISIVIIPIGNSSFKKTQNIINSLNEGILKRNCVKFLKMNSSSIEMVKNSLIDIPDSMIDFFCDNNIFPTN